MTAIKSGPSTKPIYQCMTKGVKGAGDTFEYGMSWVTSRRATLKVFGDHLECGDWSIPYASIQDVILFRTTQMFIPCHILKIRTTSCAYQFGLNSNRFWKGDLPFPVIRTSGKLTYSKWSIAARVILAVALVWYFFIR